MHAEGQINPSAARRLSVLEAEQLAATARELPSGWVLAVEAPYGQLAITPAVGRPRTHRGWVADPDRGRIYRDGSHRA